MSGPAITRIDIPPQQSGERSTISVEISARGPFATGGLVWRDAHGSLVCTIVAKATYRLAPGESPALDAPLPLQEEEGYWDDDASKSLHAPSDLAPFKQCAEVVIVGSAFSPGERPAASVPARVVVGSVDKTVVAHRARRFRRDGAIEESPALARYSLRYEHAAGGPDTDNPAGIDVDRTDARGARVIPQLLPHGFELGRPGDYVPIAGFGPLAPTWRQRAARLSSADRAWLASPAEGPLPLSFQAKFFQAAPPDQWLDRPLAANERLVLENLAAQIPRLVTSLSGIEPHALIPSVSEPPTRLTGDLLLIDTERALATLTYRAVIGLDDRAWPLRIVVVGVPMGSKTALDAVYRILQGEARLRRPDAGSAARGDDAATLEIEPESDAEGSVEVTSLALPAELGRRAALPFQRADPGTMQVPPARPSQPGAALPFRDQAPPSVARPASPSAAAAPAMVAPPAAPAMVAPPNVAPAIVQPANVAPAMVQPTIAQPAMVQPAMVAPAAAPAAHMPAPAPMSTSAPAPAAAPARDTSPRLLSGLLREGSSPSPVKSAVAPSVGVKASSDAAAARERSTEASSTDKSVSPVGARDAASAPLRRLAVVDLLMFEPKIVPRLRASKRFAPVWAAPARGAGTIDAPAPEPSDKPRADVLRLLSFGRPHDPTEIRRALTDCLDDLADLETPLVLVGGELRVTFDEIDALRVTVSVAQTVAGPDKKVLAAIAVAQEALAGPIQPRAETALALARQIEQASTSLALPPRYVAGEAERVLLEQRKFKRRTLLGSPRVRAELATPSGGGGAFPFYMPESVASSLPLLPSYSVIAICEARPREDVAEAAPEALFAAALGRVLHSRTEGQP